MHWIKIILLSSFVFLLVPYSYFFLDERTAMAVNHLWMSNPRFSLLSSNIPDLLFLFVCLVTGSAWVAYFSLVRRGINSIHVWFFQLAAMSLPISFMMKSVLKFVAGRMETRLWLRHLHLYQFHLYPVVGHYSGFPSGHMTVITVLILAFWKYYPRYRPVYLSLLVALALALIATAYHFISDIIAGVYVGFLVYYFTDRVLTSFEKRGQGLGGRPVLIGTDRIVRGVPNSDWSMQCLVLSESVEVAILRNT